VVGLRNDENCAANFRNNSGRIFAARIGIG
jgi:hypothetical protein